jgi:ribosomal protein S18 acetylase RimI-like enzyme
LALCNNFTGDSFQSRYATALDILSLIELFGEIDEYHRIQLPHLFQSHDGPAREQEYLQGILNDENAAIFVIEHGAELIGFIHVYVKSTPDIAIVVPRRYAVIETLMVKNGFKRQGLGKLLVKAAEDWSKGKGASSVNLSVYDFNQSAIDFYKKVGYHTLSIRMEKNLN